MDEAPYMINDSVEWKVMKLWRKAYAEWCLYVAYDNLTGRMISQNVHCNEALLLCSNC